MNQILFWSIVSSLTTLLILSIIRDLKHYIGLMLKRVSYKYKIGEKVVIKIPEGNSIKLMMGEITNLMYFPSTKEPVYKVFIENDLSSIIAKEDSIIFTQKEIKSLEIEE